MCFWEHIYLRVPPSWSVPGEMGVKEAAEQPGWGSCREGDALGGAGQQQSWLQQTMSQFNLNLTASDVRKAAGKQERRGD